MLLTLDIGNTEITVGWFEGETLTGRWRLTTNPDRTPDEWAGTLVAFMLQAGRSPNEARGTWGRRCASTPTLFPPSPGSRPGWSVRRMRPS